MVNELKVNVYLLRSCSSTNSRISSDPTINERIKVAAKGHQAKQMKDEFDKMNQDMETTKRDLESMKHGRRIFTKK